jgi:tetratricopeptide (TPR) repeat protein
MRLKRINDAVHAFEKAHSYRPDDKRAWCQLLAARIVNGDAKAKDEADVLAQADPTDFFAGAVAASGDVGKRTTWAQHLVACAGEVEFNALDVADSLADLGAYQAAADSLNAISEAAGNALPPASALDVPILTPILYYHLAYHQDQAGDKTGGRQTLARARKMSADFAMPSGGGALDVFQYAVQAAPDDAGAELLLGHVYAGLHRLDEALPHWRKAVELEPKLSVAWRLLGLHAWKRGNDLAEAERCFRKAIEARPGDQVIYHDLCEVLTALERRPEAITLAQSASNTPAPRYDLVLWLADAYVAEKRYDDCITLLAGGRFSNWEGSSQPRDIYVTALLGRGAQRFEAKEYEEALADFRTALTYPENLGVGARYARTDAETCYWVGKALFAMGKKKEALVAWQDGAKQCTSKDKLPIIPVPANQDLFVDRCRTASELLALDR